MSAQEWEDALTYHPHTPRCVLAWDGETHFIAVFDKEQWFNAHTDEEIDSVITHWMELPNPEE
jgi:Protein of unknown function (DUF551)